MKRILSFMAMLVFCAATASFSSENAPANTKKPVELSVDPLIGKNLAVTWWNAEKTSGKRLILGTQLDITLSRDNSSSGTTENNADFNIVSGEFDWKIKRFDHSSARGLHWYSGHGIAFSLQGNIQNYKTDTYSYRSYKIFLGYAVPVGMEYFIVESLPNLSLSIEARPTAGISYGETNYSGYFRGEYTLRLKVDPQLFLNFYF
ncbi:MAG: hypothetical protein ABII64_01170 [Elusimicrobiota bacterium]